VNITGNVYQDGYYSHLKARNRILNSILEPITDFVMLYKNRNDLNKALVKIFEDLMDFSKGGSTPIPVDLAAMKEKLETNFFGFNLTDLKEAMLFLELVPVNFSVSGALAIFHKQRYCKDVTPSSGSSWKALKIKVMNFIKENTQKRYKE